MLTTPMPVAPSVAARYAGFAAEIDAVGPARWSELLVDFADANLYQTRPYAAVRSGRTNVSHLVLRQDAEAVAAAQARLIRIPYTMTTVAYVFWGPLWKRRHVAPDPEVFRQAVRVLRTEYVQRRKCILRLVSNLREPEDEACRQILESQGYALQRNGPPRRTIIMDLRPSLDELHQGLHQKWRYHLNKARKNKLQLVHGEDADFFDQFQRIYAEMVDRKQLSEVTDLDQFKRMQADLAPGEKMRVFLCLAEGEVCAGGIVSTLGDTGIYLFGATSNRGTKTYGSYLVHWNMLEWVKQCGCPHYDLNGINPVKNPGGYQFKVQLAGAGGQDVRLLGQFDAYPNALTKWLVTVGDRLRSKLRRSR